MLGNKMLVLRSAVFCFVLAAFFVTALASSVTRRAVHSPSPVSKKSAQALWADGTEPQPKPGPWFMTAA